MDERWYMVLHTTNDSWSWCVAGREGVPFRYSEETFARYLEAYDDARQHGCADTPGIALSSEFPEYVMGPHRSAVARVRRSGASAFS